MSERELNWFEIVLLVILGGALVFFVTGCVFYRHDVKPGYDSITAWTVGKDFIIIVEPNSIEYNSTSNRIKVVTPYGIGETK